MKNYVQPGENIAISAPYALTSGDGALVGALFGVANTDADNGASVVLSTEGVYDLAKNSAEAWAIGDAIYWDNTNKVCTKTASGNVKIGAALAAAANPSGTGRVRLNGFAG